MFMRVLNVAFYASLIATVLFIVSLLILSPWNDSPTVASEDTHVTE